MAASRRPLIAGNWKMNGTTAEGAALATAIAAGIEARDGVAEVLICPPATLLARLAQCLEAAPVALGGQDCHAKESGAHTGDVSAEMLRDAGATYVIVGHSERRTDHGESDADVAAKVRAAWRGGLTAIVCIGETLAQREAGETLAVLGRQVAGSVPDGATAANLVLAYEPVWAIGTGRTASVDDVDAAHRHIRAELGKRTAEAGQVRLLYGGSVKPDNAQALMAVADVDGALVGGASLKAADFLAIVAAAA